MERIVGIVVCTFQSVPLLPFRCSLSIQTDRERTEGKICTLNFTFHSSFDHEECSRERWVT